MGWFIFAILLGVVAIALLGAAAITKSNKSSDYPNAPLWLLLGGVLVGFVAVLCLFGSMFRSVPARNIGVPSAFGSVGTTYGPGVHFPVAPWTSMNIIPETIQTTVFKQTPTGDENDCITVRIGGQQQACLDATIQWRIEDTGAPALYKDYNGTSATVDVADTSGLLGTVASNVVVRELEQVVNNTLGDYNPIEDVSSSITGSASQFSLFDPQILRQMQADLKGRVQVLTLFTPFLHYDPTTQARINSVATQYADTAIAKEELATNQAQSAANHAIASSVSNDPSVLTYQCLTLTETALKDGDSLPIGWNCFGGDTGIAASVGKG
jgi:SPFH domain / Band 7 family